MKVDPKTLMFTNMSREDRAAVMNVVLDIMNKGRTPWPYPEWLSDWFKAGNFDEHQSLLVISTVFPQKALLSILNGPVAEIEKLSRALCFAASCLNPEGRTPTAVEITLSGLSAQLLEKLP